MLLKLKLGDDILLIDQIDWFDCWFAGLGSQKDEKLMKFD